MLVPTEKYFWTFCAVWSILKVFSWPFVNFDLFSLPDCWWSTFVRFSFSLFLSLFFLKHMSVFQPQHLITWSLTVSCQCSWLRTSVCKWRIEFDFDVQNFHLVHHRDAYFFSSCWTESCAVVKRNQVELADDSLSVGKSTSACQKKMCACVLSIGSMFSRCRYSSG